MNCILIDHTKIKNLQNLKRKVNLDFVQNKNFKNALLVLLSQNTYNQLNNRAIGKELTQYIESSEFINSIESYCYINYNSKKNICIIDLDCCHFLDFAIPVIEESLKDIIILVNINLKNDNTETLLRNLINNNFTDPYITKKESNIYLTLVKNKNTIDKNITVKQIIYVLQQFKNNTGNCYLTAQFSNEATRFLKTATDLGHTKDKNGSKSQKEISGEMYIKSIIGSENNLVYNIDVDQKSIKTGEKESIKVDGVRYNFHSHPREAYIRHSVKHAWPSVTDYMGYYLLGADTIFHSVITIEGIYIISFSSFWSKNLSKVDKRFIIRNYDIGYGENYTPTSYVDKMNKILFQDHPIFNITYLDWENCNNPFKIFFPQIGSGCLTNQNTVNNYRKINK